MTTIPSIPRPEGGMRAPENALEIEALRSGTLSEIVEYLQLVESAYNHIYAFELLVVDAAANRPSLRPGLDPLGSLMLSRRIPRVHDLVAPADQLFVRRVVIESPGVWEFLGALNPLEVLRKYLNDRHERKKDRDFRNPAEAQRLRLENEKLRTEVVRDWVKLLSGIGVPEDLIRQALSEHLVRPFTALDRVQDSGLIGGAVFARAMIEVKPRGHRTPIRGEPETLD